MTYQKEEEIEYLAVASNIAQWSVTRYGYFVNSSVDKVEMVKAFAEELAHLPDNALRFVDKAKHKWVDESHKRPPTMPDFLTMLREFHNADMNEPKAVIEHKQIDYAGLWDSSNREERFEFFKRYDPRGCSTATKYWAKKFYLDNGWSEQQVREALCQ